MSMSDPLIIYDQFGIIQNHQTSPIPRTSFLPWPFFAISYSKSALELFFEILFLGFNNTKREKTSFLVWISQWNLFSDLNSD